jgi:hypothetical protein
MRYPKSSLTLLAQLLTCAALTVGSLAYAQDSKPNPVGIWTWSVPARDGGEPRKSTLTLKKEGEKITGKLVTPGRQGGDPRETEITDGKLAGDKLTFTVTREFNGNKFVQKYEGKVSGDTITGKVEFERNGETMSRDWNAKREAEKKTS